MIKVTVSNNDDFLIGGTHDVDQGWIQEVRKQGAKVVPRVLFDRWTGQNYVSLFQDKVNKNFGSFLKAPCPSNCPTLRLSNLIREDLKSLEEFYFI